MALTALIASRDPRTRTALRAAVAGAGAEVVAEACDRWQAGEALRSLEPDVAVVDARLLSTDEVFLTGWGPVARCTRVGAVGDERPRTRAPSRGGRPWVSPPASSPTGSTRSWPRRSALSARSADAGASAAEHGV